MKENAGFMFSNVFPKIVLYVRYVEKYVRAGQATDNNKMWHMHFACWISKATRAYRHALSHISLRTQTNMYYLLLSHDKSGFVNASQCYITCTLPVLLIYFNVL